MNNFFLKHTYFLNGKKKIGKSQEQKKTHKHGSKTHNKNTKKDITKENNLLKNHRKKNNLSNEKTIKRKLRQNKSRRKKISPHCHRETCLPTPPHLVQEIEQHIQHVTQFKQENSSAHVIQLYNQGPHLHKKNEPR